MKTKTTVVAETTIDMGMLLDAYWVGDVSIEGCGVVAVMVPHVGESDHVRHLFDTPLGAKLSSFRIDGNTLRVAWTHDNLEVTDG